MTRAEIREAQSTMKVGRRFEVTWRFAESDDAEASPWVKFSGVVVSQDMTEDGPVTLVDYDRHPQALPTGGILPFPPPMYDGRMVLVQSVKLHKAPSTIPDLTALTRPAMTSQETPKRQREEDPETATVAVLGRMADRLDGTGEKFSVGEGLKIPKNMAEKHRAFYPNFWVGKPVDFSTAMSETMSQMGVRFLNVTARENFFATKSALAVLLASARVPETKQEWLPLFSLSAALFGACVLGAGGTTQRADAATSQLRNQFEMGFVNVPALWTTIMEAVQKAQAMRGRGMGGQVRGGGRGGGRGRGA